MNVGVTGGSGFLGWHVRARLEAGGHATRSAGRDVFADPAALDEFVAKSDVIIHAAGVNRASTEAEIADGNRSVAADLVDAMRRGGRSVPVLYTNSMHCDAGNTYGDAKQAASDIIAEYQSSVDAPYLDLILPHLFGEFGRPHYNSVVSTFAHELAVGGSPDINRDGQLELLHAQDVADRCLAFAEAPASATERMQGRPTGVGEVWDILSAQHRRYVDEFTVPFFASRFQLRLFNVLRSQLYDAGFYPRALVLHEDPRGAFAELCRADCLGQTSVSTSAVGITRGDHFHFDKIERFVVLNGEATIRLRKVLDDSVASFDVVGDAPVFIDMPPLVTHNITNTGSETLTTLFWAADHFDPANPDTYVDPVEAPAV